MSQIFDGINTIVFFRILGETEHAVSAKSFAGLHGRKKNVTSWLLLHCALSHAAFPLRRRRISYFLIRLEFELSEITDFAC